MSYILIDAGNSCLKLAILDELDSPEMNVTILGYDDLYNNITAEISNCIISGVVVSNVSNPVIFHTICDVVYNLSRLEPYQVVVQQDKYNISTRYKNPRLLGSDRWLALIAARAEFSRSLCVIDCGTAVTIDALSEDGMHIGGFITPGLKTSRDSLGLNTNNLPFVKNPAENSSFLAITTQDAILGGTLYQLSAYIDRMVTEIKYELGENIECIITGGDANLVQGLSSHCFHYREKLVFDGLRIITKDLFVKELI